jgi:DNA-binding MarR family transcriptional regulator
MLLVKNMPEREAIESFLKYSPETNVNAIEALINLIHVSSEVFSALDIHFARNDISQGRFHVLMLLARTRRQTESRIIAENKGATDKEILKMVEAGSSVTPAEIAEFLAVTRATITGLLDKLESDGLILRVASRKDRRKQNISMTGKSLLYMKNFLPEHFKRMSSLMSGLTTKECKELIRLLTKVKASVPTVREP